MKSDGLNSPFNFLDSLQVSDNISLQKIGHSQLVHKNIYVFRAGDFIDDIYIVLDGRIKITV